MSTVSPSQSAPGEEITAAKINNPINQIATVINGNIDVNNIADGAISTAKLVTASVTPAKLATGAVSASLIGASTTASTAYTSTLADALTLSVTATIGANGLALVTIGCTMASSTTTYVNMSYAMSGANTAASNDNKAVTMYGANFFSLGQTFLLTGLTAGSTVFTAQYNTLAGTATFNNRRIAVVPL